MATNAQILQQVKTILNRTDLTQKQKVDKVYAATTPPPK